jgi:hypothetical protein
MTRLGDPENPRSARARRFESRDYRGSSGRRRATGWSIQKRAALRADCSVCYCETEAELKRHWNGIEAMW